ncbi:twisted gastrulation protein homolog 1-A-like [Glandiceps talaboti]
MKGCLFQVVLSILAACYTIYLVAACNEGLCASDVSRCQLMMSCRCDPTNYTCGANCSRCLGNLWTECCDCVDLCKPRNHSHKDYAAKSSVEDLTKTAIPSLFDALTEDAYQDTKNRWSVYQFSHIGETLHAYKEVYNKDYHSKEEEMVMNSTLGGTCTVAYVHECLSLEQCELTCQSMGASAYRWFHTNCCECVGHTCLSYGKNEPLCKRC